MIRDAVIAAAGMGTRMRSPGDDLPKPLRAVRGRALLARVLETLSRAGVERFHVIVGYRADLIREAVAADPVLARLDVRFIQNDEYEKPLGISVLKARGHVTVPFVLSMSDHIYDDAFARAAVSADLTRADLYLCVDRRLDEVFDIDDCTRVLTDGDRLVDLDKGLAQFDAVDCGVFAVTPALFDALEEARAQRPHPTLSDGVKVLAKRDRARVVDVGNAWWLDVDDPKALAEAERVLGA